MSLEKQINTVEFAAHMRERARLIDLIREALACDLLDDGTPCGTDLHDALPNMAALLRLHDYRVTVPVVEGIEPPRLPS